MPGGRATCPEPCMCGATDCTECYPPHHDPFMDDDHDRALDAARERGEM